jgi:hypothetical protein
MKRHYEENSKGITLASQGRVKSLRQIIAPLLRATSTGYQAKNQGHTFWESR